MLLSIVLLGCAVSILCSIVYWYGMVVPIYSDIAGPKPTFFFGHALVMRNRNTLPFTMSSFHQIYGPILRIFALNKVLISVSDVDEIKKILAGSNTRYSRPPDAMKTMQKGSDLPMGLLFAEGEEWKKSRRILTPLFSPKHIREHLPVMINVTNTLLQDIEQRSAGGRAALNAHELMCCVAMDIIGITHFDVDFGFVRGEKSFLGETVREYLIELMAQLSPLQQLKNLFDKSDLKKLGSRRDSLRQFVDSIIARSREEASQNNADKETAAEPSLATHGSAFLQLMLRSVDAEDHSMLTDKQITAEMITFLIAGFETTANMMSWALLHLARNPECQEKLHAEVYNVLGSDDPSMTTGPEMKYLDAVTTETARITPVAPLMGRSPIGQETIVGHVIQPRTRVINNLYAANRDQKHFSNPEVFSPERFTEQGEDASRVLTFGYGPRQCIGMRFAELEMRVVLPMLVRKFRFELEDGVTTNVPTFYDITMGPKGGLPLKFFTRAA